MDIINVLITTSIGVNKRLRWGKRERGKEKKNYHSDYFNNSKKNSNYNINFHLIYLSILLWQRHMLEKRRNMSLKDKKWKQAQNQVEKNKCHLLIII